MTIFGWNADWRLLYRGLSQQARSALRRSECAGLTNGYLSRYTHRVAISNSRLLRFDEDGVTLRYKDYRRSGADRQQVMTLSPDEFIRRFLLHALPRGFHRIRHYGLLASGTRKDNLERARALLNVAPPPDDDAMEKPADVRPPCPCCGGQMIIIEILERRYQPRAPPPLLAATRRSAS